MAKNWTVSKGQRYVQREDARNRHVIWEVGEIDAGGVAIPHARLVKVDDPLRRKTISCFTLTNPSFYRLLSNTASPADPA